ncbi:MAG TPA: transcription termination factor Rho [Acidimicrobiales bacterium]|nr:transcription termination factor Rho [Acidimicrobiales bacterium]
MSIAPQALERSVLERKERDELAAIAEAMGVKPSARASKSTLIDSILREAGIETGAEERPKRSRSSRAAQSPSNGEGATDVTVPTEPGTGPAQPNVPVIEPAPPAPQPETPAPEPSTEPSPPEPATEPSPPEVPPVGASAGDGGGAGSAPAGEAGAAEAGQGDDASRAATSGGERTASDSPTTDGPATDGPTAQAPAGQSATASTATTAAPADAPADTNGGPSTPAPTAHGGQHSQPGGTRTDERQRDRQRDNRGDGSGEPGNRRSRRRRGRNADRAPQQDRDDVQYSGEPIPVEGLLDLHEKGYGFLRTTGYLASPKDVYVSVSQVRRFGLRKGDYIKGASRPAGSSENWPALLRIDTVSGMTPDEARQRPKFEDLTPLFPDERLRLEIPGDSNNMVARIVDLISPIGKGQRGLIVSPPKAGKTTVLKQIAHSIEANNPEVHLMVLLVDERPEEVTDMRRSVKGEVIASTFDRPSDEHTQVAELTLERAKRLVEVGTDVCIVLDGITRLSRAYNLAAPATGRIMSGGIDVGALYPPKKFFGSARNIEEGGSITILATALVETGSRMDEVIFEEFKGTGNMELRLDRKLAERRIYPALDVNASSTRHEELLFERNQLQQVWKLRRVLNALEGGAGLELLMDKIKSTKSNDEFLAEIAKAPMPTG